MIIGRGDDVMGGVRGTIQRRGLVLAAVMVASVGLSTPTSAAPSSPERGVAPGESIGLAAPVLPEVSAQNASVDRGGYWTPEKMAGAAAAGDDLPRTSSPINKQPRSAPPGKPGTASEPVFPSQPQGELQAQNVPVPRTVGRLFYVRPNGSASSCTAATINSAGKDVIQTAGHCIYTPNAGWNTNVVFAPAYYNGVSYLGTYDFRYLRTFVGWTRDSNYYYDQAFIELYPRNGVNVVDAVGGNGFSWNQPASQPNVRIFGYPAEGAYDGQYPYYCQGSTFSTTPVVYESGLACGMTGGASGGPWLKDRISEDLGYVWAVTSRRSVNPAYLVATPNSDATKRLYDLAG